MPDQFAKAAHDLGVAAIEFPGADGRSECVLVGVTQRGQCGPGSIIPGIKQFTFDDP